MNILYLRSNYIRKDSRFNKEVKALDNYGIKVTAFCWNRDSGGKDEEEKIFSNSTIYKVNIKSSFGMGFRGIIPFFLFQYKAIKHILKNYKKYDYIHCCDFDTGFITWLSTRFTRTRYIYDIYDYYADSHKLSNIFRKIVIFFENRVINNSYTTIICTEKREEQIAGSRPKKLVVIHNAPPSIKNEDVLRMAGKNDIKQIAYFGIFEEGRMLIELMRAVSEKESVNLQIGGYGLLENVVEQFDKKSNNIHFCGTLDYDDVLKMESKCDIVTALYDPNNRNHYYAAPNKFYEGAMLGIPIIMAEKTGMSDLIAKHQNGVILKNFTQDNLEKAIDVLVENYEFYRENALNFKAIFDNTYSWDIMEKRLHNIYLDDND